MRAVGLGGAHRWNWHEARGRAGRKEHGVDQGWKCREGSRIRLFRLPLEEGVAKTLGERSGGGELAITDAADRVDIAGGGGEEDLIGQALGEHGNGEGLFEGLQAEA